MIGVAVHSTERDIAGEFFELFKTPWEFCQAGQQYDVIICTQEQCNINAAKLVLLYGSKSLSYDSENKIELKPCPPGTTLRYHQWRLPLYGNAVTFPSNRFSEVCEETSQNPMAFSNSSGEILRIGYDLFQEVRMLLTVGQPPANAGTPTLELHIAFLRDLIVRSGLPLVEIPPVPAGHNYMVCLTHDLDNPILRNHRGDHTMFGFLYRAIVGSLMKVCRGRETVGNLCQNWAAAGKLPLVYLGMARDPWQKFDRYLEIEEGLGSTYFVISKKNYAGQRLNGRIPTRRSARYAVEEIKPQLEKILSTGCEVALHGLDAWLDSSRGVEEQKELSQIAGVIQNGVRMHWLYFNQKSPTVLDQAGFTYDSTVGYNETVGYRAGTSQAYKPLGATKLLELPLVIMDTALFYPNYLNLSKKEAEQAVNRLLEKMVEFGGALTINWHDRSIAPERLWNDFYFKLLEKLKCQGVWFPTAAQAALWFRKRRSATFGSVIVENDNVKFSVSTKTDKELPGLKIRVHRPKARNLYEPVSANSSAQFVDTDFNADLAASIALSA